MRAGKRGQWTVEYRVAWLEVSTAEKRVPSTVVQMVVKRADCSALSLVAHSVDLSDLMKVATMAAKMVAWMDIETVVLMVDERVASKAEK